LFPTGPFEGSNRRKASRIIKSSWCRVSSRHIRPHVSLTTRQKLLQFGFGMSCLIRLSRLILRRQIFIYLDLCKILLLKKISLLWKKAPSLQKVPWRVFRL